MVNLSCGGLISFSSSVNSGNVLLTVGDTLIWSSGGSSGADGSTLLTRRITPITHLRVEIPIRFESVPAMAILSGNKVL